MDTRRCSKCCCRPEFCDHIRIVNVLWVLDSVRAWSLANDGALCPADKGAC